MRVPTFIKNNPVPYVVAGAAVIFVAYVYMRGIKGVATDTAKVGMKASNYVTPGGIAAKYIIEWWKE